MNMNILLFLVILFQVSDADTIGFWGKHDCAISAAIKHSP